MNKLLFSVTLNDTQPIVTNQTTDRPTVGRTDSTDTKQSGVMLLSADKRKSDETKSRNV